MLNRHQASAAAAKAGEKLRFLMRIYAKLRSLRMNKFLSRWRQRARTLAILAEHEKKMKENEENYAAEAKGKAQKLETAERKLQQKIGEVSVLKEGENSLKTTLREKEAKEKAMRELLDKFKQKDAEEKRIPKKVEERMQKLEAQAKMLEKENQVMREQLDFTETDVNGFINEMNEVLDSTDFGSMCDGLSGG